MSITITELEKRISDNQVAVNGIMQHPEVDLKNPEIVNILNILDRARSKMLKKLDLMKQTGSSSLSDLDDLDDKAGNVDQVNSKAAALVEKIKSRKNQIVRYELSMARGWETVNTFNVLGLTERARTIQRSLNGTQTNFLNGLKKDLAVMEKELERMTKQTIQTL